MKLLSLLVAVLAVLGAAYVTVAAPAQDDIHAVRGAP